ncbi:MAG: hypothetical protein ACR2IV_22240 [Bryobacteraceae bacterium]
MPRHKFQSTEEQRRMVKALAGYGVKQQQIAALLDLASTTTLRKHFPEELRQGALEAKAQMLGTLFKMAVSGRHPTMTMFFLKTRAGWCETGNQEEPIEPNRRPQWVVRVYQPPRSSEQQKELETASEGVHEVAEWEEFTPM